MFWAFNDKVYRIRCKVSLSLERCVYEAKETRPCMVCFGGFEPSLFVFNESEGPVTWIAFFSVTGSTSFVWVVVLGFPNNVLPTKKGVEVIEIHTHEMDESSLIIKAGCKSDSCIINNVSPAAKDSVVRNFTYTFCDVINDTTPSGKADCCCAVKANPEKKNRTANKNSCFIVRN